MKNPKTLRSKGILTRRLEIRPYRLSDFDAWRAGHLAVSEKIGEFDEGRVDPRKLTKAKFKARIGSRAGQSLELYSFGVFERRTGRCVGNTNLAVYVRWIFQWANLGYEIHNTDWRKGYGTEAARATLRIAFEQLGLNRVEASTELDNLASVGVMKSAGMKRECVRERFMLGSDGVWQDMVVYASVDPRSKRAQPRSC